MAQLERANFGSKLGIILATAGSAGGLGHVWQVRMEEPCLSFFMSFVYCCLVFHV